MKRSLLSLAVVAIALVIAGSTASGDMSKPVIKAFKGKILITDHELAMAGSDKETIAEFKKAHLAELKGSENSEGVQAWTFNYSAFLSKTGATELKLEFYAGDKYVADQRLIDVDPKDPVLVGQISINEDDGPAKGKKYTLKLVAVKGNKETVVASTPLTLN
jgi:hypothetical protein